MKRWLILSTVLALVLAACASGGPVRRISDPAASIQQLSVGVDGNWTLELRLQNYSSIPMRFERLRLDLRIGEVAAGSLDIAPGLQIGGERPDILSATLAPSPDARLQMVDALATGRTVAYALDGSIAAAPTDRGSARDYVIRRSNGVLSPVPGLPGVLR